MRLRINRNKNGSQNFYVLKSYRDANGKSTSKIVEKLGTYEELAKLHEDPVAWAKAYVDELNRQEQEASGVVEVRFCQNVPLEMNEQQLLDGGYLFLQKIYHELRLDYICSRISPRYGFEYSLNKILQTLLYSRILYPTSKLGTFEYASRLLEAPDFEMHDVYRALSVIAKETDFIQAQVYKFSCELGKRNDRILYYDCTNYYFEIEEESGIRKYGISKEHRPNPIVEMGLFMDGDGIPLAFCLHSGNTSEQKTLIPLEKQIIRDFGHAQFIVCTDAGLSSRENRSFNDRGGRCFVTTQSIKKMNATQKEWALSPDGWRLSGGGERTVYSLTDILSKENLVKKFHDSIFYKEQWVKENGLEQRIIVSFSIKHRNYQRSIRQQQIERARKVLLSPGDVGKRRQVDYKRLIKTVNVTEEGEIAEKKSYYLDENVISEEEKYDGFYAVATNLEDNADAIISLNTRRWEIEECFRIMKSEFSARPVYLSRDDRIKAHFTTCYLALILYRYLEKRLGGKYTCCQIIDGLRDMKFLRVPSEGYIPAYTRTVFTDDLHKAFGFRTDYQILSKSTMRKIVAKTKEK